MNNFKRYSRRLTTLLLLAQLVALFCLMPAYATDSDSGSPEYEATINELIDFDVAKEMDDYYKALYAFEQLKNNCVYDYETAYGDNKNYDSYEAYGAIVNGTAVCSGYARAYKDLLDRMGVPCEYLSSFLMNHAWNQVQIDGNWYHVDPTGGLFLCSDDKIRAFKYHGWVNGEKCSDTTYDEDPLMLNFLSQLGFLDANYMFYTAPADGSPTWMVTTDMVVMRKNIQTEEVKILCKYEESNVFLSNNSKTMATGLFISVTVTMYIGFAAFRENFLLFMSTIT